jgi:F5/8 type C domain
MKHFGTGTIARLFCSLALLGYVPGCIEDEPAGEQAVSWEVFRSAAAHNVDGREIYIVEWDLAVTEEELRQRYEAYVARLQRANDGIAEVAQPSIVHQHNGVDDIWQNNQQLRLTYCVSDDFGANKARAVSEVALATAAWEGVARVDFTYLSAHDANCSNANPNVVFSVRPWTGNGACAFFPAAGAAGCVERTLVMNFASFDTFNPNAPNMKSSGVFRHELGHILGLRHEQTRPEPGVCFENNSWRPLTPYDQSSVMHYPWCNGTLASDLTITSSDALGASLLYGGRVENLAVRKPVAQSSTASGGAPSRAVDGNTDGTYNHNSVTHTNFDAQAWWQVDLEMVSDIGEVIIYNRTDCCSDRLSNFDIKLSNDGVNWQIAASFSGVAPARSSHSIQAWGRYVRVQLRGTNNLSLAEVQVKSRNLALGRPASQSSTNPGGASASRATDGNTDGNYGNGSVTHTNLDARAWWQVDLGSVIDIGDVVLHNRTDCCSERLSDFDILLSNDGVNWVIVAGFTGAAPARLPLNIRLQGRYVRVQLRGTNYLSLAEVEVFRLRNLAAGRNAYQSSTYEGASASRAVDGNTDGNFASGSVTHTNYEASPWWAVDLGSVRGIGGLVIYNRTDCCSDRLSDFDILLSDDGSNWWTAAILNGTASTKLRVPLRKMGRYVAVQLRGTNHLNLAEVQVVAP